MERRLRGAGRGDYLAPCNPASFDNPLDLIVEEHLRERQICAQVEHIATDDWPASFDVEHVLRFLESEYADHMRDETQELFPLLLERCEPEDDIQHVVERLNVDYAGAGKLGSKVVRVLKDCLTRTCELNPADRKLLMAFVGHARRHLIVENAIVLPLARARLTEEDLTAFRLHILRRRGFVPNE
ncbi:MAG: hemerythrin domain-containing protein [Parvibaculum sp.]